MKKIILKLIKAYQRTISPDHGIIMFGGAMRCRFYPSCSQYTYEAVSRYGILKGALKGLWRILRCSPLSKGGIDPVRGRSPQDGRNRAFSRAASNGVDLA